MIEDAARIEFAREVGLLSRRWRARLDERLRHLGLTQSRWHALLVLSKNRPGVSQRELADQIGVEGPTLVRQLDDLQRQGLVERCPVEGDRRVNKVTLTPAAEPLIKELTAIAGQLRAEALQEISDAELAVALDVVRRVNSRLEQA